MSRTYTVYRCDWTGLNWIITGIIARFWKKKNCQVMLLCTGMSKTIIFWIVPKFGGEGFPTLRLVCWTRTRSMVPLCHTTWRHISDVNKLILRHRVDFRSHDASSSCIKSDKLFTSWSATTEQIGVTVTNLVDASYEFRLGHKLWWETYLGVGK